MSIPNMPNPQEVNIQIDWTSEPTPVYSNGAQVVHSPREFCLVFTDFAGFAGRGAPEGVEEPRARVVSSVRVTPDVFFQLAAACASNWNKYINHVSEMGMGVQGPKFKLIGGGNFQLDGLEPAGSDGEAAAAAPPTNAPS